MKKEGGQSLIELLVALGVLTAVLSAAIFILIDSYLSNSRSSQISLAIFLAEEGLEATGALRNNNWQDLTIGEHGLVISGNQWVFQGQFEDISSKLKNGQRIIKVEDKGVDRKKVTSQILWQTSQGKENKIELVTYFTNWQKVTER